MSELSLPGNNLTPTGIRRLIRRPELPNLRVLVTGSRAGPAHRIDGVVVYE
jgi:hypothetical protein